MPSTDQLSELISRKHGVLVQLREAGQRQIEAVAAGQTAELLRLLAAKQQLISALQAVEELLAPFRLEDPEQRIWRSAEDRAHCAAQASECNEMLSQIVALEQQSTDQMTLRRNNVASQLEQIKTAGEARTAYSAQQHSDKAAVLRGPAALRPATTPSDAAATPPFNLPSEA